MGAQVGTVFTSRHFVMPEPRNGDWLEEWDKPDGELWCRGAVSGKLPEVGDGKRAMVTLKLCAEAVEAEIEIMSQMQKLIALYGTARDRITAQTGGLGQLGQLAEEYGQRALLYEQLCRSLPPPPYRPDISVGLKHAMEMLPRPASHHTVSFDGCSASTVWCLKSPALQKEEPHCCVSQVSPRDSAGSTAASDGACSDDDVQLQVPHPYLDTHEENRPTPIAESPHPYLDVCHDSARCWSMDESAPSHEDSFLPLQECQAVGQHCEKASAPCFLGQSHARRLDRPLTPLPTVTEESFVAAPIAYVVRGSKVAQFAKPVRSPRDARLDVRRLPVAVRVETPVPEIPAATAEVVSLPTHKGMACWSCALPLAT